MTAYEVEGNIKANLKKTVYVKIHVSWVKGSSTTSVKPGNELSYITSSGNILDS